MPDKKSELLCGGSPSAGSASNADTQAARKRREADEAPMPTASGDDSDHQVKHPGADRSSARSGAGGQQSRVSNTAPHGEQGQKGAKDEKSSRS